jgi:hypothetical protein
MIIDMINMMVFYYYLLYFIDIRVLCCNLIMIIATFITHTLAVVLYQKLNADYFCYEVIIDLLYVSIDCTIVL